AGRQANSGDLVVRLYLLDQIDRLGDEHGSQHGQPASASPSFGELTTVEELVLVEEDWELAVEPRFALEQATLPCKLIEPRPQVVNTVSENERQLRRGLVDLDPEDLLRMFKVELD